MLFELQPAMRKQSIPIKQDTPKEEGGKLRQEVRTLLDLPKPKGKAKQSRKRGAVPATPLKR